MRPTRESEFLPRCDAPAADVEALERDAARVRQHEHRGKVLCTRIRPHA
jgi:hypothetical protein